MPDTPVDAHVSRADARRVDETSAATSERGRRWYHPRPQPRVRADLMGFNYTWWLFWIFIFVVLVLPW